MPRTLGTLLVVVLLVAAPRPARSLELRHGPELQGGLGHFTLSDEWAEAFRSHWEWEGGFGWFVEVAGPSGTRFGSGLAYRRVGDEVGSHITVTGGPEVLEFDYRSKLALEEIALPLRAEHSVPGLPMLGVELGAQAEYVLRAMQDDRSNPDPVRTIATRQSVRSSRIFEVVGTFDGERELTFAVRRLAAAASGGLTWRTRVFSREAAVAMRYERGLTGLWKDGADRFASRAGLSLRVAW